VKGKYIPVEESFKRWDKERGFNRAYDALKDEFELAAALIDARGQAGLSQEDVAARMKTSQQTVSRLEGGRANPSLRTLRRFARATGTRLKISFERAKAVRRAGR
jgi:ribosome-binding protein aMBF1 (putative translation factor)